MKKALPFILLGAAALLFCGGVSALAANVIGGQQATVDLSKWKAPYELVDAKKLDPAIAVGMLAGATEANTVDGALAAGDWEGALALVAYDPDMSDVDRIGTLLLLGSRYAASKQTEKAAWVYHYAVTLAMISPQPSDLVRVQTFLEAAQGLHALRLDAVARQAVDQADLVTNYSYSLPRDTRADLFQQIARGYASLGVTNLAQQARQQGADAASLNAEDAISDVRAPFRLQSPAPRELPELKQKLEERVEAARELYDSLSLNPPQSNADLPQDLISALGDKLYEEDGLRVDFYSQQLADATDAAAQLGILRDKIRWLALKLRIGRGGYGLSLVPEWESETDQIAQDLNDAYTDFFQINEQQASGLEKVEEADRSTEDILRSALLAGRWGFYSQYDETDLRARLGDLAGALRDEQVPSLRLDSFLRGNQVYYLLVPDELVGQGEKALPR